MYLKSLSVVSTLEELVVPYNQFNKNLVGGGGRFGQVLQLQSMPYGKSRDFFFPL
jgi:hypothetical protein